MSEFDRQIRWAMKDIKKSGSNVTKGECPPDDLLTCYLDGVLPEGDRESIERHLAECADCLDAALLYRKIQQDESAELLTDIPVSWKIRAKNLFSEARQSRKTDLFDVVLKFAKDAIEIIKNPSDLTVSYAASPIPVRGESKSRQSNLVILGKDTADVSSHVEVERISQERANIKVSVMDKTSGSPVQGARASLVKREREIASSLLENGEAHFTGMKLGGYIVTVTSEGKEIVRLSLNLED